MAKYRVDFDLGVGPEDLEAGLYYEVVHTQPWQDGKYLPPVAQRCTQADAERICALLNGNDEATRLLRDLVLTLNTRGTLSPGGCDFQTETGTAYRAAHHHLWGSVK